MKREITIVTAVCALAAAPLVIAPAQAQMACCQPSGHKAAKQSAPAKATKAGVQKATVTINGGYSPANVTVTAGKPVELTFVRKSAAGCDGELVIPDLKVQKTLKQGEKTVVKFTPKKSGTLAFSCGMNMYKGSITVK